MLKSRFVCGLLFISVLLSSPAWAGVATDLAVTIDDGVTMAIPGESITYTAVVTNTGADNVQRRVFDFFPNSLTCTWSCVASVGSTCAAAGSGDLNDYVNLLDGGTATYTITCDIDPGATGTLNNTIRVPLSLDVNQANNTASDVNTVLVPTADLSITKVDSADPVSGGAAYFYTVEVTNAGPSDATGVVVTDTLPAGVTLVSTSGCAEDPNGVPTCTLGTVDAGDTASYTINVTAPGVIGQLTNNVSVTTTATDPDSANDAASETTDVTTIADLTITKTDTSVSAIPGLSTTYVIVATNNGPDAVTGATVTDNFISDLTCTWTCVASAGSSCAAMGSGNINESVDLLNGGTATFTAVCNIDPSATTTLVNFTSISSSVTDPVSNNGATDGDTALVPTVDLSITKTDSVDPAPINGDFTYTMTVSNAGPSDATGVVVTDVLPAGVTLVSSSGCAEDPAGAPTCTLGTVAAGGMASYTLTVTAPSTGTQISNTATVSTSATDTNAGNDSATETTDLTDAADLTITKTDSSVSAIPGQSTTYVIVATNNGPAAVTGATVTDTFQADLTCNWTCVASAGSSCAANGSGDINESVDLLNGGTATFTAVCDIDPGATGTLTNFTSISSSQPDPVSNNGATDGDTALVPTADLSITKTDSADPVNQGDDFTYTITVSNAGPSDATDVVVTDTLPAGVTLVSTSGCAEDPNAAPTCTLGTIAAGGMASYTLTVTAPGTAGQITNNASVATSATDNNSANDSTSETTDISDSADLAITKTDGVTLAIPGNSLTYTIVASNNGLADVTGATVTDTFPAGLTCTWTCAASSGSSCTGAGSGDINESVDLLNGGTATFTVTCDIDPAATGTLSNTASITSSVTDPTPGNNSATDGDTVLAPSADLSITKADSADPVGQGEAYTYTLTVSNAGPSDATGVVVTDNLPVGVTLVSTSGCAEDPAGAPTCTLGTIAAGGMASFTIDVTAPNDPGQVSNTATVASATTDPNAANDSATETTDVTRQADLSITKTDGVTSAAPGDAVTYTIVVTNNGPDDVTGGTVTDTFPSELTCVWTCVASAGSSCTANGSGDISESVDLLNGGTATFTAVCDIDPAATGTLSNTATVTSSKDDPNTADNSATDADTVLVPTADLSITKVDSLDPVGLGQAFTYTLTVSNAGPSDATNVVVTDTLPAGVTLVSTSGCAEDPTGVPTCSLGTLTAGSMASYTIDVTAPNVKGQILNTASVASDAVDNNSANDTADESTNVAAESDVAVTKTDGVTSAVPGESVTYTIVVTNNGPDDVSLVAVEDLFSADLTCAWTCAASAGSSCTASGSGDITEMVDLLNGGTATFTAVCDIAPGATGTLSNTVSVTAPVADPNPSNDTATDNDTVLEPSADLVLVAMTDPNPVAGGEPVTIFVDVMNLGPSTAQDVVLDSMLAPELTALQSFGCAEDPGGIPTCTLGMIEPDATRMVEIEAIAPLDSGDYESTFTVSASTADPDSGNDVTLDALGVLPELIEVPTLGTFGLMVMVLLMGGLAVRRLRP